jgi:hypothetical protein
MMPPIGRIVVEIRPQTHLLYNNAVVYVARIEVDAGGTAYAQEQMLTADDFTSRFDWMIDFATSAIRAQIERDNRPTQESPRAQAQEVHDAPSVHAED